MKPRSFNENRHLGLPSPFAPSEILSQVHRPHQFTELPAIANLGHQLSRIAQQVDRRVSKQTDAVGNAVTIARRFQETPLVGRVTQESTHIPHAEEETHELKEIRRLLDESAKRTADAVRYLQARVLPDTARHAHMEAPMDGWIYFQQGDRTTTSHRICLSPKLPYAAGIFLDIIRQAPREGSYALNLRSHGTSYGPTPERSDEVELFVDRASLPAFLQLVERIYRERQQYFEGQPPPSQGVYAPAEGVSVGPSIKNQGGSHASVAHEIGTLADRHLREKLHTQLVQIVQQTPGDVGAFKRSTVGALMWKSLAFDGEWSTLPKVGKWSLESPPRRDKKIQEEDEDLSRCYLEALYEEWILSLRQNRPIDQGRVKQIFIDRMREEIVLNHSWVRKAQEVRSLESLVMWSGMAPRVEQATQTASLAASVYRRQKMGQDVGEAMSALLKGKVYDPSRREE
jgi:hypothetical protein